MLDMVTSSFVFPEASEWLSSRYERYFIFSLIVRRSSFLRNIFFEILEYKGCGLTPNANVQISKFATVHDG